MIPHSTTLLKSTTAADDYNRPPPISLGSVGVTFGRGIIIGSNNNNNSGSGVSGARCGGGGVIKKVVQHHGKTHPLVKINQLKHRIIATSTTAATA